MVIGLFNKPDGKDALRTDSEGHQIQTTEGGFFANLTDQHRKIEHWGIRMAIILSLMTTTVCYAEVSYHNQVIRQEMTVNPSGTQVQFSKAKATLTLKKAIMSRDGHWAFIPFTLSDMKYLPNDPSQYQVLLQAKGNKHAKLAYKPVMRLILFGSSGKGAIALYSATGIQNQPVNFFIVNLKPLADTDPTDVQSDATYGAKSDLGTQFLQKKYDIVSFSANPGAKDVQTAKRTDATISDKAGLYMGIFGGRSTKAIHEKIAADNKKINQNMAMINEDKSKLTQMKFELPKDPAWMQPSWRPFDAVNPRTGKTKTGKNALNYINSNSSSADVATDDKDSVKFPATLKSTGDIKMDDQGGDTNSQGAQASDIWQDLQTRWQNIHQWKRDIWVTQQAKLYAVRQDRQEQKEQTTIGPSSRNLPISKIRIRKMQLQD